MLISYDAKFISEESVSGDGREVTSRMPYEFEILHNPFLSFIIFFISFPVIFLPFSKLPY
jgi:hypothetical protein